jgi:integral membrane protein
LLKNIAGWLTVFFEVSVHFKFDPMLLPQDNTLFILQVILMLQFFRAISILEGLSFIAILSISFGFLSRDYVFILGMVHGVLFMLYLLLSMIVSNKQQWSLRIWLSLFVASIVPFAFIGVEIFLSRVLKYRKVVEV